MSAPAVFRPTAEEFMDPMTYICSIQKQAESAGIAKIVPYVEHAPQQNDCAVRQCDSPTVPSPVSRLPSPPLPPPVCCDL